jgi:2-hydroxymuconate-semialdehyde hydrolase
MPRGMTTDNPEIGKTVNAGGLATNYHDIGSGPTVVLLHGSGPGVSAWANWRLVIPALAQQFRVVAPDIVGFGYTERPPGFPYHSTAWRAHLTAFLDALEIRRAHVVGNSFGGALALGLATQTERVDRMVLMGSAGLHFEITPGLDTVWGYEPSFENMRKLLELFVYDPQLATDELAQLRFEASTRPRVQEAFAAMFPAPRQRWVDALALPEADVAGIGNEVLVVHGREDQVVPLESSLRFAQLIRRSQLHVFGQCGHWTQIEWAGRFSRQVVDFLSEGRER